MQIRFLYILFPEIILSKAVASRQHEHKREKNWRKDIPENISRAFRRSEQINFAGLFHLKLFLFDAFDLEYSHFLLETHCWTY